MVVIYGGEDVTLRGKKEERSFHLAKGHLVLDHFEELILMEAVCADSLMIIIKSAVVSIAIGQESHRSWIWRPINIVSV